MAIFGKNHGKNVNFSPFGIFCFQSLERRFFVQEYFKTHFAGLYCVKKNNLKKLPFFDQKQGLTPQKKCQFFHFLNLFFFFFSPERRFFGLEYHKRHFPSLYCQKKKVGKMAIFGPKPWVNPFGKMSIFDFLTFLFLEPRKAFFCSRIS